MQMVGVEANVHQSVHGMRTISAFMRYLAGNLNA